MAITDLPYEVKIKYQLTPQFNDMILWCTDKFGMPNMMNNCDNDWSWDRLTFPPDVEIYYVFGFKEEEDYTLFTLTWA